MLPLIYTMPAYTIAFVSVVVVSRIPEIILLQWRSRHDPTARKEDGGSLAVMSVVVGGGVIAACVLPLIWMSTAIVRHNLKGSSKSWHVSCATRQ
jgi:hypothetical protein